MYIVFVSAAILGIIRESRHNPVPVPGREDTVGRLLICARTDVTDVSALALVLRPARGYSVEEFSWSLGFWW